MALNDSIEFRLIVDCCRRSFRGEHSLEPQPVVPVVNWTRLIQLARHHRVQGLAWEALAKAQMPPGTAVQLSADARSIAASNLAKAREYADLNQAFSRAGLELLFLKGLTVAALAYRVPMLKMGWDIDVLVARPDLQPAIRLLADRGYEAIIPPNADRVVVWHSREKESVWARPSDRLHVELHTRLADNLTLIPSISIHSPRQQVEITPGVRLPTLADDELFAYLAVHGASSAWFRLKWISDFAGFVHRFDGAELERLYDRSQEFGAGRAAGQALLLADKLFGTLERAPRLRTLLGKDRPTVILGKAALRLLLRRPQEPTEAFLGTWPIHWTQLLLLPGVRYKLAELRRQVTRWFRNG